MRRPVPVTLVVWVLAACGGEAAPVAPAGAPLAQVAPLTSAAKVAAAKVEDAVADAKVEDARVEDAVADAKVDDARVEDAKVEDAGESGATTDIEALLASVSASESDSESAPVVPPEVPIRPWVASAHTPTWTLRAEPAEVVTLVDLHAGLLGRAGSRWLRIGDDGQLAAVTMNVEPKLPILGVWPSDAWFVDQRFRDYGDGSGEAYLELRLMKLRGGNRWVPQVHSGSGEQWFHPGTEDEDEAHISTVSGMLVYPRSLERIKRVAGRLGDPEIGAHRGEPLTFLETGSGAVYLLSTDAEGVYAQTACEDEDCLAASVRRLPPGPWSFGRRTHRGKLGVSVVATGDQREFVLHHDGKGKDWVLDELPAGERPTGMWASHEGGLWTVTAERLRWRDVAGVWRDVALPDGLSAVSVALSEDRKQVWVSGAVAGSPRIYTTASGARP